MQHVKNLFRAETFSVIILPYLCQTDCQFKIFFSHWPMKMYGFLCWLKLVKIGKNNWYRRKFICLKLHLNGPYRDNSAYLRRTVQFSAPSNYLVQVPASYSQENAILVIYQIGRLSLRDKLKFSGKRI